MADTHEVNWSAGAQNETSADTEDGQSPDESVAGAESPEPNQASMPETHAGYNIDPATMTKEGLIKACPRFADIAAKNPELGNRMAEEAVQSIKTGDAMRQAGMDGGAVRSQKWAAMGKRHQEKTGAKLEAEFEPPLKSEAAKPTIEPAPTIAPTQVSPGLQAEQMVQPQPLQLAKDEATKDDPPITSQPRQPVTKIRDQLRPKTEPEAAKNHVAAAIAPAPRPDIVVLPPKTKVESPVADKPKASPVIIPPAETIRRSVGEAAPIPGPLRAPPKVEAPIAKKSIVATPHIDLELPEPELTTVVPATEFVAETTELDEADTQLPTVDNAATETAIISTTEDVVEVDNELELQYMPETTAIDRELLAIITDQEADSPALSEPLSTEENRNVLEAVADIEIARGITRLDIHKTRDFEVFLAEQPKSDEPVTLEIIQDQAANARSLEQIFAQLAEVLSANEIPAEQPALYAILKDIEAALPACYLTPEEGQPRIQITPELTEKLLVLLRQLGYEQPGEVLVDFVSQHSLAFLLQALQFMCQLNNEDDQKEFLAASVTTAIADDDDSTRLRLSKLLAGIAIRKPLPLEA